MKLPSAPGTATIDALRLRLRDSILMRPAAFVVASLALAWVMLTVDSVIGPDRVPASLRFPPGTARLLLITLAGATLTVAGITFWVRAASVQLAAGQYTPRVVHGFLQDWFQQSMMGLLVGFFAYMVSVLRVVPDGTEGASLTQASPHLSILVGTVLAGAAVLVVLVAIRNGVRSMQPGELARRITDLTVGAIRDSHAAQHTSTDHQPAPPRKPPAGAERHRIGAAGSGWVQRVDEDRLLAALPPGSHVRLDVRVGLLVVRGRPLCTVWSPEPLPRATDEHVRRAVQLGRSRVVANDVHYGIQQLVDVGLGCLAHGTSDAASAYEVIVHLELVLRELLFRELPPAFSVDEAERVISRPRAFTFDDYVREAFARLRLAVAPHPTVTFALLESIGSLVTDLENAGHHARVRPLRREGRLTLAASGAADLIDEDLAMLTEIAEQYDLVDPGSP